MIYCIDTSSLIDAGEQWYPQDVFPKFWTHLEELINESRLKAPETLLEELSKKSDAWRDWVYERRQVLIMEIDADTIACMEEVVEQFRLVNPAHFKVNKLTGDPFFIALAKAKGMTLVTSEKSKPGGFKIPTICQPLGVKTMTLLGMIRAEKWTF